MNRRQMILRTGAALFGMRFVGSPELFAAPANQPKRKVLFFTRSQGYEHFVIKRVGGKPSFCEKLLSGLGEKHNIDFTFSKDGSLFSPDYLDQFDALFFYTTGDLTKKGSRNNPPMTPEGKAAFLDAVSKGKGFIGTHAASDTFHSPGSRYQNNPHDMDPYIAMLGGEFIIHGAQQRTHLGRADRKFPGEEAVPAGFGPHEEWYSLKNFAPQMHVLLVQETAGMRGYMYDRPNYPSTWAHAYGDGRVFYTNMGHRQDVWTNPVFQQVLLGGLNWATRRVSAYIPPNLQEAAPHCMQLPKPPKGGGR